MIDKNIFDEFSIEYDKLVADAPLSLSHYYKQHKNRFRDTIIRMEKVIDPSRKIRILDVGFTVFTQLLRKMFPNSEVYCIDQAFCNESEEIVFNSCNLNEQKIPYEENYFDIIIFSQVFEHLNSPLFALREFFRVLKPGGHLQLSTPNFLRLASRIRMAVGKNPLTRLTEDGRCHIREYDKKEVEGYLRDTGFCIKSSCYPKDGSNLGNYLDYSGHYYMDQVEKKSFAGIKGIIATPFLLLYMLLCEIFPSLRRNILIEVTKESDVYKK